MKFIIKTETFWNKKIRKTGEVVDAAQDLSKIYPNLFEKCAVVKVTEPEKGNDPEPEKGKIII